jgi:hypothetical protein
LLSPITDAYNILLCPYDEERLSRIAIRFILIGCIRRKIECAKAQARAKVGHPFRVIKRKLGCTKAHLRELMEKTAQQATLISPVEPVDDAKRLLAMGELRL